MKADYKNWMPKGMVMGTGCGMIVSLVLFLILGVSPIVPEGSAKRVIGIVFLILTVIFGAVTIWMYLMYRAFSYNGKRQTGNPSGDITHFKEGRYILAIHDIMSKAKYGDMQAFVQKLKDMGYDEVKLVDTTSGMFMTK